MLLLAAHLPLGKMFSPHHHRHVGLCTDALCFQLSRHNILMLLTSIYFLIFVIPSILPTKINTYAHHAKYLNDKLRRRRKYL